MIQHFRHKGLKLLCKDVATSKVSLRFPRLSLTGAWPRRVASRAEQLGQREGRDEPGDDGRSLALGVRGSLIRVGSVCSVSSVFWRLLLLRLVAVSLSCRGALSSARTRGTRRDSCPSALRARAGDTRPPSFVRFAWVVLSTVTCESWLGSTRQDGGTTRMSTRPRTDPRDLTTPPGSLGPNSWLGWARRFLLRARLVSLQIGLFSPRAVYIREASWVRSLPWRRQHQTSLSPVHSPLYDQSSGARSSRSAPSSVDDGRATHPAQERPDRASRFFATFRPAAPLGTLG